MKNDYVKSSSNWMDVLNSARTTVNKEKVDKEPSSEWKRKILLAEHSPIRKLVVSWKWLDIKSWISVHFVRHKFGIEHFVSTQRNDRTNASRDDKTQDSFVEHECAANAQAIINISRKRLCYQAHMETRTAWIVFLNQLRLKEPELYSVCVKECVYRGFCPEMKTCGFTNSDAYTTQLKEYRTNNLK